MRFIFCFSLLFLLLTSCSQQKSIYFPVLYKGWVQVPASDTGYTTSFFQEDGRMRLSCKKEGDFHVSWNLEVLKTKYVVFGLKAEEIQIDVSPGIGVGFSLKPYYLEYPYYLEDPSEVLSWDDFEFVLSETSEFFMLYERPGEIEHNFYIEGIVKLTNNARRRRIKRLISKSK